MRVAQRKLSIACASACLAGVFCASAVSPAAAAKPRLKVLDASAPESAPALKFKVKRIGWTEAPIRVSYTTVPGSAAPGTDFQATNGQLAFQPATKERTIVVKLLGDAIPEGEETLGLKLWKPIGASIGRSSATGAIGDDDVLLPLQLSTFLPELANAGRGRAGRGGDDPGPTRERGHSHHR